MNQLLAIKDRLRRADEHLDDIKALLRAYYEDQTYNISGVFDPVVPQIRYTFGSFINPVPFRISTIAGEVFHDLRSSLDHLAWELVEQHNPGAATDKTSFPILKSAPTPNQKGVQPPPTIAGGVSATSLALIERVQPYQLGPDFGADPLYVLHVLNIIDKHRHVTIRGVRSEGSYMAGNPAEFAFTAKLAGCSEWGAQIEFVPDDPTLDLRFQSTFQVAVHEYGYLNEVPLLQALLDARNAVWDIMNEALSTCFPLPPPMVLPG